MRCTTSADAAVSRRTGTVTALAALLSLLLTAVAFAPAAAAAPPRPGGTAPVAAPSAQVPTGVTAGIAVFDR
ncbi:hypothetical protein [Streptomyces griseosporeus]|uniref:hypothetical protein n=1 Tax=Streptomyces griseosporeus TaxID=1910 RepID=UPI0036FEE69F